MADFSVGTVTGITAVLTRLNVPFSVFPSVLSSVLQLSIFGHDRHRYCRQFRRRYCRGWSCHCRYRRRYCLSDRRYRHRFFRRYVVGTTVGTVAGNVFVGIVVFFAVVTVWVSPSTLLSVPSSVVTPVLPSLILSLSVSPRCCRSCGRYIHIAI